MEIFLKLFNKMVLAILWTADFDANLMRTTQAPVWIELPMLHLILKYYFNQLFTEVGKVIYAQTTTSRSTNSHTLGGVYCTA